MKEQPISFPLTNAEFLKVISNSFCRFLRVKTSRSPEKLKPLHGAIAADLSRRLGEGYHVCSQGFGLGKEFTVRGRYVPKRVDITIFKQDKVAAGVAVKFVMQNYSQNSNNYFENMLGETANIRAAGYPYFQIFIIQDQLPYYRRDTQKTIQRWETFTKRNASKYICLSRDDANVFYHTPNKTLIYVVHLPENRALRTKDEYMGYYRNQDCSVMLSEVELGPMEPGVILNDYETFIEKVYHTILAQ